MDVFNASFHVLYIVLNVIWEVASNVMKSKAGIYKKITHVKQYVEMV